MFGTMKRNGFLTGSTVALVAAVLGATVLHSGSPAVHAAPSAVSKAPARQQVGYAGQLAESVTGQYPVVIRLYGSDEAVLHEETVTADIQRGKFQAVVGSQFDLTGMLRDTQKMRVFFQGNLVDTVSVIHATPDYVRANPDKLAGGRAVVVPPEASAPMVSPRSLVGTCSVVATFVSMPSGDAGLSCTGCGTGATGVMVSCGYQPISGSVSLNSMYPNTPVDWHINLHAASATSVELLALCCQ